MLTDTGTNNSLALRLPADLFNNLLWFNRVRIIIVIKRVEFLGLIDPGEPFLPLARFDIFDHFGQNAQIGRASCRERV